MIEIKIPSPGESITEVEIASWLVQDGDVVEKDQEIAEIESDKATLPLIAEESGKIEIVAKEGETIHVGEIACKIDTSVKPKKKPDKHSTKEEEKEEKKQPEQKESDQTENAKNGDTERVKVSPVAKKMMEEEGLSLEDVLHGLRRISGQDIKNIINQKNKSQDETDKEPSRNTDRQKMSQLRKKLSERLVSVKNETAMLTTFNEVDMTNVISIRKKYQKQFTDKHGIKLGFMSFFTKAVTIALKNFPAVNSQIDGEEIIFPEYADIGIAVQTPKGLMVPVVRNAESMSIAELEKKIKELADKGRNGRISLDDLSGGTFTITNGGVFGSMLSTPILNPPQSGILGMHNIMERPVAVNRKVEIRPMMYIALSYDHRTIDGKDSVGFLIRLKELLESPLNLLNEDMNPEMKLLDL